MYTKFADYKKADGSIDWSAYKKAQLDNGEICSSCRGYITSVGTGKHQHCFACKELRAGVEDASHNTLLRCPHCRHLEFVDYERGLHEEGSHSVSCSECDSDYNVETRVTYSFTCSKSEDE